MASALNVLENIVDKAPGTNSRFMMRITSPLPTYAKIMNGTKIPTTFPIDLTPPKMTNAVTAIMTIPVTTIGMLNELFKARLIEFVWTPFPIPKAATDAKTANKTPSHFFFKPCSK